jgi:putative transposase
LSRYVDENQLSLQDAVNQYPGMESFLLEAWQQYKTNCKQVSISESRKAHPPSEQFSSDSEKVNQIDDPTGSGRKVS